MPVLCDGLQYGLARRVINCTFRCPHCSSIVYGLDYYLEHKADEHSDLEDKAPTKEFDWVLLLPGPGHIEINFAKSCLDLTWGILWEYMVKRFDFKSPNALLCAKNVLIITRHGLCARLLEMQSQMNFWCHMSEVSCQPSKASNVQLSPAHFFKYVMHCVNPNYSFMADCVLELLDSIFTKNSGLAGHIPFTESWRFLIVLSGNWEGTCHVPFSQDGGRVSQLVFNFHRLRRHPVREAPTEWAHG